MWAAAVLVVVGAIEMTRRRSGREQEAARLAAERGVAVSNRKGWHSQRDFFERREPASAILRAHVPAVGGVQRHVLQNGSRREGQFHFLRTWQR